MRLRNATRLRLLAAEALAISANMTDAECRRIMTEVAAGYERLADHAEQREAEADATAMTRRAGEATDAKES
jgi:hypothetical protein